MMTQEYPYSAADIDLTQINWDRFCRFDALHAANGDAMLRVLLSGKPVMALRFDDCSLTLPPLTEWDSWLRDRCLLIGRSYMVSPSV